MHYLEIKIKGQELFYQKSIKNNKKCKKFYSEKEDLFYSGINRGIFW